MGFTCKIFGHKWERLPKECLRRCRVCGTTEAVEHQWKPVEGQCREECTVCGKRSDVEHSFVGCKCVKCGEEKHSYIYADGDATDLQCCTECGEYDFPLHLRDRSTEGTLEMFEKLISLHGDILPQIFWGDYHISRIAANMRQFPEKVERILNTLYERGVQIEAIDDIRKRIEENKKNSSLSDAEIRRQEYDANADEGIFRGGVRGGW